MTKNLNLVYPSKTAPDSQVSLDLQIQGKNLVAEFKVTAVKIFSNPDLPKSESQWGLWDWDVVELFVSGSASRSPYYEFQVSPLGQYFELEIFEPRVKFNKKFRSGFVYSAKIIDDKSWTSRIEVPLERLGWDGDRKNLTGNAFAIVGEPRTYWSLHLPQQQKPDFHLPHYFKPLG